MTYAEVLENAKKVMAPKCQVCLDCNGKACAGKLPGVGAKGDGSSFTVCREYLKSIKINMDVIHPAYETDASIELFGKTFKYPFFVAPIGGMSFNYTNYINDVEYTEAVVYGAKESGIFAFTGDGPQDEYFTSTLPVLKNAGGLGVSTIKPWKNDKIIHHIKLVEETGAMVSITNLEDTSLPDDEDMGLGLDEDEEQSDDDEKFDDEFDEDEDFDDEFDDDDIDDEDENDQDSHETSKKSKKKK